MLAEILKRLAEMFPRQDYQSRLERYISSHSKRTIRNWYKHWASKSSCRPGPSRDVSRSQELVLKMIADLLMLYRWARDGWEVHP